MWIFDVVIQQPENIDSAIFVQAKFKVSLWWKLWQSWLLIMEQRLNVHLKFNSFEKKLEFNYWQKIQGETVTSVIYNHLWVKKTNNWAYKSN